MRMADNISEVLEFSLIQFGDYHLTVYHLLKLLIFFLVAKLVLWITRKALERHKSSNNIDSGSHAALIQIITYLVWTVVIVLALESIGVKVTILIAGSAALLVGIGLGLQQTFNDIFSGIILLIEGSIKVDDVLKIGDEVVKVRRIGLRTSIVQSRDETTFIMPNSKIVSDTVINWSHSVKRARFGVGVGVTYGTDVDLVLKLLVESANEHPFAENEMEPFARLTNFGDSSLDFEVYFWSRKMYEVEQIKSDIRRTIVRKFKEHGVIVPFPQRDIHFKSSDTSFNDEKKEQ